MAFLAFLFIPLRARAVEDRRIKIIVNPPVVGTRLFEPKNRPVDMHSVVGVEGAVCRSAFDSRGRVTCRYQKVEPAKLIAKYAYIEIESVLVITIWLPHGHTQKQKDHEEGHRRIAERVYLENSERIARQVAAKYIGKTIRKFQLNEDPKKLASDAGQKAAMGISILWLKQIVEISKRLNESYDSLTDHGRNNMAEDEAIELAFTKDVK